MKAALGKHADAADSDQVIWIVIVLFLRAFWVGSPTANPIAEPFFQLHSLA